MYQTLQNQWNDEKKPVTQRTVNVSNFGIIDCRTHRTSKHHYTLSILTLFTQTSIYNSMFLSAEITAEF